MFFLEVSNNMFWFFVINSALIGVIFLLASKEIPESPKYYYMQKNYRRARSILSEISEKYRGKRLFATFKEEATEAELKANS